MNANNDNQIVYIAKSKLLEIYNDIFYDWKDEFKRTYEKETVQHYEKDATLYNSQE